MKLKKIPRKILYFTSQLLLLSAPLIVANTQCMLFVGEPKCPDCLKK